MYILKKEVDKMLKVENLYCGYDDRDIVKNISFEVKNGENLCVVGPNGCGKSTLLKSIANIIEYKGPGDSFSIDDFYKVLGYACIYKTATLTVNEIKAEEITLTFAVKHFPRAMIKEIQRTRNLTVVKFDEGIYHIIGGMFPIQMIHTVKLSEEIVMIPKRSDFSVKNILMLML